MIIRDDEALGCRLYGGVTLFIDFPLMNLINDRAYVRLWCTITKYLIMTKIESVHFLTRWVLST
uniref:Uncharacterized protein n=1 Tax=Vibrio tasmaniensis TaxID=212663 RepID=A0A0H3ZUW5_9VIBR|nr:hypothetical protein [Vibrio tasmaniensis]